MGLDMSIYVANSGINDAPETEIAYWRKHPNLHGFFEEQWNKAGWKGNMNCVPFELTEEILDVAIFNVMMNGLPQTEGFFFGESQHTKESVKNDLEQLKKAKKEIVNGNKVFYVADW